MQLKKIMFVTCACSAFAMSAAHSQTVGKAEDQVRWRQSAFSTMGWSMGRIKSNVSGSYNKEQVVQAANTLQALANSNIGSLFAPGTESAKGWKKTEAKPALFTDKEGANKAWLALAKETDELARLAATGDAAAVKAQFGKVGQACKGCHDKFRVED
jgi:cytochrome c556